VVEARDAKSPVPTAGFITRDGLVLREDGKGPFVFVSFNIPNLTYLEDPWRLPTR
jgi:hypothetical protein